MTSPRCRAQQTQKFGVCVRKIRSRIGACGAVLRLQVTQHPPQRTAKPNSPHVTMRFSLNIFLGGIPMASGVTKPPVHASLSRLKLRPSNSSSDFSYASAYDGFGCGVLKKSPARSIRVLTPHRCPHGPPRVLPLNRFPSITLPSRIA